MRCAPNQMTATDDPLTTNMTIGNINAISRPTPSETSISDVLASSNRFCSRRSRTNARITRMPAICSRITRLTRSMRTCMDRKSGRIRDTMSVISTIRTGTTTTSSPESGTSWLSARMMPPTHMIGAETMSVNVISTSICSCWTSLVVRVISDGAPKCPTSRAEKSCTRLKMADRTSRPRAMAVRAPKYTAAPAHTICASVMVNMTPPSRMITPVSPFTTPSSMMSALSVGR